MKRILAALAAAYSAIAFGTTLTPIQLLSPAGSASGQVITSTGASTAPTWGNVSASTLAAQAANTVIGNATSSSASPTAITVAGCNGAAQALQWTNGSGFQCNSSIATSGANANITSLTGLTTPLSTAQGGTGTTSTTGTGSVVFSVSPSLTGTPTVPTATAGTNTTQAASTAYVQTALTGGGNGGSFTTLSASSTVSGTGFSTYLASPPSIGATTPAAGKFTTLQATGAITPAYPAGIVGNTTGSNVTAGSQGEYPNNTASAVAATSATLGNVVSLPLTAGDWDVGCTLQTNPAGTTTTQGLNFGLTTTSGAQATFPNVILQSVSFPAGVGYDGICPTMRLLVSGATTVYLTAATTFSTSTLTHSGYIWARRR